MKMVCYIRENSPQTLTEQLKALQGYSYDELYVERETTKNDEELKRMLETLEEDDVIVVCDICVFRKSIRKLGALFEILQEKGVHLVCLNDDIDTRESRYGFYDVMKVVDKLDHYFHVTLTREGLDRAKEKGIHGGRPQTPVEKIERIKALYQKNRYSLRTIGKMCDVSLGTVHKYVKELQDEEEAEKVVGKKEAVV